MVMAEVDLGTQDPTKVNGFNGEPPKDVASTPSPHTIVEYLKNLLHITLNATQDDLQADESLLSDAHINDTVERCARFLQGQRTALYVQKHAHLFYGSAADLNGDAPGM